MKIRRVQQSDAGAIAGIILAVFREGSTYTIDPDISEADALAYWLSSDKTPSLLKTMERSWARTTGVLIRLAAAGTFATAASSPTRERPDAE